MSSDQVHEPLGVLADRLRALTPKQSMVLYRLTDDRSLHAALVHESMGNAERRVYVGGEGWVTSTRVVEIAEGLKRGDEYPYARQAFESDPPIEASGWTDARLMEVLAAAAQHLLDDHDCDGHGHEQPRFALTEVRRRLTAAPQRLSAAEHDASDATDTNESWRCGGCVDRDCTPPRDGRPRDCEIERLSNKPEPDGEPPVDNSDVAVWQRACDYWRANYERLADLHGDRGGRKPKTAAPRVEPRYASPDELAIRIEESMHTAKDAPRSIRLRRLHDILAAGVCEQRDVAAARDLRLCVALEEIHALARAIGRDDIRRLAFAALAATTNKDNTNE